MLEQVGSPLFMLVQVVASWPQDACVLAQVGLKMFKMASQGVQKDQ